jgi:uncharacterized protein (DUF4415 family)
MNKIVTYNVDLANLPPLTEKQKAELMVLANMPDDQIDYSDIPPLKDDFFKNATRGHFYRPVKSSTTVRVDSDVLAWLKGQGKGYQTRINAILRDAMLHSMQRHEGGAKADGSS